MDDTSQKIIDATMLLIRDKGYVATTTKDIAKAAGVNECTIFRKFSTKMDIVNHGLEQLKWRADISMDIFEPFVWDIETDLEMIMKAYLKRITPDFVKLSIGLRAPQIYEETAPWIRKIPETFIQIIAEYLKQMYEKKQIPQMNYDCAAMTIFSSMFGYTFLSASFDTLMTTPSEEYIHNTIQLFARGLRSV